MTDRNKVPVFDWVLAGRLWRGFRDDMGRGWSRLGLVAAMVATFVALGVVMADMGEAARWVLMFGGWVVLIEYVLMIRYYWQVIVPLRHRVGDDIIAPPVWWTFGYHVSVAVVVAGLIGSIIIRLNQDVRPTPAIYVIAAGVASLIVCLREFAHYYRRILTSAVETSQKLRDGSDSVDQSR